MKTLIGKSVQEAVSLLQKGGIIVFPTETTYGLGCDPRNAEAVERIFAIKGRDWKKPLLLVAGSWVQVEEVVRLSPEARAFARQYWPGPLTLVLPKREDAALAPGVVMNEEVSIRYSSSEVVRRLTEAFGFPIIATSANLSGQPDNRSAQAVQETGLAVDYIFDGGDLPFSKPSTLARVQVDGTIKVIREGAITFPESHT